MAKRRLNGEGSITFHKSLGLWYGRVYQDGRYVNAYRKSKEEVRKAVRELQRRQDMGEQLITSSIPLKDYLVSWLASSRNRLRPSTYEGYEAMVRVHLIPRLGDVKLIKLTPEQITQTWDAMVKEGHSGSVIEHCQARLSKALNDAVKRNLIHRNPCQFATTPKVQQREMKVLDLNQINHLLEVAKNTEYYAIIHAALYTGLRRNELLGLIWKDIDLDEAVIYLNRSIYRANGETIYQPPKTAKGRRAVALTPSSAVLLRGLREQQGLDGIIHGYEVSDNSPVFRYSTGEVMLPDTITHQTKRIFQRAGLEDYRFHDNRHTHASLMLRQGVHPKVVQERLGHAKVGTTMDIYSHVMPTLQKEAVKGFDLALETAGSGP